VIRKSGYRFSEKICSIKILEQKNGVSSDRNAL
jgi:hypothetical protein